MFARGELASSLDPESLQEPTNCHGLRLRRGTKVAVLASCWRNRAQLIVLLRVLATALQIRERNFRQLLALAA